MKIFGLSVLEDSLRKNTCFRESIASIVTMSDESFVFIRDSNDGTERILSEGENFHLHIIENNRDINILQQIREACENIPEAWCLYLKDDEVLDNEDFDLLREDVKRASELGCSSICFRNLNFTDNPHIISISSKNPAHSIRMFRLGSDDFLGKEDIFNERVYYSEVTLFNYDLVRKIKEGFNSEVFQATEVLNYLGKHPALMKRKIENWGGVWSRIDTPKIYIVGEPRDYKEDFIKRIKARKILWVGRIVEVPVEDRGLAIIITPSFFHKLFRPSRVPVSMMGRESNRWSKEFILTLKLSEKGISVG